MNIKSIKILADAELDLQDGRNFYDSLERVYPLWFRLHGAGPLRRPLLFLVMDSLYSVTDQRRKSTLVISSVIMS